MDCQIRVRAKPLGPVGRLEPRDGGEWMTPSDRFRSLSELRSKIIRWQRGRGEKCWNPGDNS